MAKLHEEVLVVKISALLADRAEMTEMADNEMIHNLEAVIKELLSSDQPVMIEIERA
jgi:hypothetical protein